MHKLTPLLFLLILSSCCVQKVTDLTYRGDTKALVESLPRLDDYQNKSNTKYPIVIFIHGGYWEAVDKDIYKFLGRSFAQKNNMAKEVATGINWTRENISEYEQIPILLLFHKKISCEEVEKLSVKR
jgi:hypothetical protein